MIECQSLRQGQEGSITDTKEMPLLRSEGCKRLDGCPGVADPPVEHLICIVAIGSMARTNSRCHEVELFSEGEELGIFAAAQLQRSILYETIILPAINQRVRVAVAAIHMRRCSRNVHRQLRHHQIL